MAKLNGPRRFVSALTRPKADCFAVLITVLAVGAVVSATCSTLAQDRTPAPNQGKDAAVVVRPSTAANGAAEPGNAVPQTKPNHRKKIPTTPIEVAEALGIPFLTAFVISSVIAVWFTIERLVVLRRGRVIPRHFVERFLQNLEQGNLDPEQAIRLCEENASPIATIFAHGIRKWGKPSVEVEQAIIDGGERQVSQLRNHLRVLNAVATIGPLLGLLGTVVGMIQCFNEIATSNAMGKADQLAGGIATALLCTAVGLLIAIPSLTMYMYLAGRVDTLVMDMDLLAQNVVNLVSSEASAEGAQTASKGRSRRPATSGAEAKERKAV